MDMMRLSALYFVLLSLFASSLSKPDIEQSLANFRKALGAKLLTVDAVPQPPAVIISTPAKPVHTNIGIIQNYLGTESNNETADAIQVAHNLVSSGILPGFKPVEDLSPLSDSNPNYSGSKKPCHHKDDVTSNKDTVLKPFSDSNKDNTPVPQTAKPCHHKETPTEKPLSQTETPLQPNKESHSDSSSVTKKPCHHSSVQTTTAAALTSNNEKVDIVEHQPDSRPIPEAPQLPPWQIPVAGQVIVEDNAYISGNHVTIVQPELSISSSHDCNKDKIEIVERPLLGTIPPAPLLPPWHIPVSGQIVVDETSYIHDNHVNIFQPGLEIIQRPVSSPIPPAPLLSPWQIPVAGQIVVDETSYIPDNHVNIVQPGLSISSSSHDCNKDKIEIIEQPVLSYIPPAPLLPPWQIPVAGQIVVDETSYIPDNHVNIVQPGLSISPSSHDCNKEKIEIIEQPVLSHIPPAPLLPPWQIPVAGHVTVEETQYVPDSPVAIVQHVPSPIPEAPQLQVPVLGQVVVEENAYIPHQPCPNKTFLNNEHDASRILFPNVDKTNIIYNQGLVNFPPVLNGYSYDSPAPVNVGPLPAGIAISQSVIETADLRPAPLMVDVPSSYTYQQVKGDGSVETTFALQDGVHTRFGPNPYLDISSFPEYSQRPAINLIPTDVKSYNDRVYSTGQSQYEQYPHIASSFNEYNVHNRPYDYNKYPVQHQPPQRPYNPYQSGHNNGPRPQVNNYHTGHHVHPQSFNHPQQHSYGGYSYKQIHGDGSITSHGSDGNVQTLKSPQMTASREVVKKPAPQAPFAYNPPQSFNYPEQQMPNNVVQPSYGGYSYKQVHGDGTITSYEGSNGNVHTLKSGSPQLTPNKDVVKNSAPQVPYANNVAREQQNFNVSPYQVTGDIMPGYSPIIAQEGVNPMYFSYMFKQLGFNGAKFDSGSKAMPSPAKLPVVNTNVRRPDSALPSAANTVSINSSTKNNVHVTSYSGFTNGNDKFSEANRKSEMSATTTGTTSNTNKGTSEVKPSGPGFKVAYGIGEKTASKKRPIEYNPIIVLDTTTSRGNYYYGQTDSDGFKTEYIGDKEKVVVQNIDDSPKINERRKFRGDIPEAY